MSDKKLIQVIMDLYNKGHSCNVIAETININTAYVFKVIQNELRKADLNAIKSNWYLESVSSSSW